MQPIAAMGRRAASALSDFAAEIGRSLYPRDPSDVRLVDEQVTMARDATRANVYTLPIVALLLGAVELQSLPLLRIAFWPLLLAATGAYAELRYRRLQKRSDRSPQDVERRARFNARTTLCYTLLWCGMGYDLFTPGNATSTAILFTAMACSLAAWSAIGAYHFATALAPMPVYLITLTTMALSGQQSGGWSLALMAVAFWLTMRANLILNYRTRERMLRLQLERSELIDNLRTAKDESDAARQRAELANQAKSAFLANMSHELRTPLNAIMGFSEIIRAKVMGPAAIEQYAEYAGYIHSSGDHLLSLINDILDLAKIEAGRIVLHEGEIDLRVLMDETARMMSARATLGGLSLAVHVERSFPNLYADERALRQILVNLSSNAIKFTPPGGRVTAFASVLPDGSLAFGIDDDGIGIAPEDHSRVFESFGQARHDAIVTDKGTGLGLPIVKGLAEAHGGTVVLNSVPDEGTRITIVLPPERARARLKSVG